MQTKSSERRSFSLYLRTGVRSTSGSLIGRKFNPYHDPADGRFTSGGGNHGAEGIDERRLSKAPLSTLDKPGLASIRAAEEAERVAGAHSTGKCYAFVKRALLKAGVVSDYLPGIPAKEAGLELSKRGFVNLLAAGSSDIKSPYDAPVGSVVVYDTTISGSANKYGHIEIRTKGGFASDYKSINARTGPEVNGLSGRGRVVTGVWVKR